MALEDTDNTRLTPLVLLVNLGHRLLRGLYLKFGRRGGFDSIDNLPFSCAVYALGVDDDAPEWVRFLRSEAGKSSYVPVEFAFSTVVNDLHLLPRVRVMFVDSAIAVAFMQAFHVHNTESQVVVVGPAASDDLSAIDDWAHRFRVVAAPKKGGGRSWLQQFS